MNPTKALALITTLLLGTSLFAAPANTHSTTATTKDTSMNTNQETDRYTFELSAATPYWPSIRRTPAKAAANRATSPRPTSTRRTSARRSTISA
jgi:hypothetical protein